MRSVLAALAAALALAGPVRAQNLFWLDTSFGAPALYSSDPNGFNVTRAALSPGTLPEGLAVESNGRAYFTEAAWSNARVQRVGLFLQGIAPIVYGGSALRGIAVDERAGLLYWTTSNLTTGAVIQRSTIDGTALTTLITLPPGADPRGIAVDHTGARIYWADFDHDAIYRANLDGSLMTLWQTLPVGSGPYGVAFDPVHGAVLWTEYNTGAIRGAATGGFGYGTLTLGLQQPTYLAVDALGGNVYWTEGAAGAQRLARMSTTGGTITPLPVPLATYGGVAFSAGALASAPADRPVTFAAELWPIPAAGPVHVSLALPVTSTVRIAVLDVQGRELVRLPEETLAPGRYQREWTGEDARGRVPAGLYFVRIEAGTHRWTRRAVLAR